MKWMEYVVYCASYNVTYMKFILATFRFICPKVKMYQFNIFYAKRSFRELVYEGVTQTELIREG
jgi:hypothetical protein